jgi:hypothetical protein
MYLAGADAGMCRVGLESPRRGQNGSLNGSIGRSIASEISL